MSGSSSAPTLRQRLHFGRELVVAADADHLRSGADRKQHLGQAGTSETMRCAAAGRCCVVSRARGPEGDDRDDRRGRSAFSDEQP